MLLAVVSGSHGHQSPQHLHFNHVFLSSPNFSHAQALLLSQLSQRCDLAPFYHTSLLQPQQKRQTAYMTIFYTLISNPSDPRYSIPGSAVDQQFPIPRSSKRAAGTTSSQILLSRGVSDVANPANGTSEPACMTGALPGVPLILLSTPVLIMTRRKSAQFEGRSMLLRSELGEAKDVC